MRAKEGCGLAALGALFVLVACLILAAFTAALVRTGELPLYAPRLTAFGPDPNSAFHPTTVISLTFDQPMDPASVKAAFALEPAVPGTFRWNADFSQASFAPGGAGYEPGTTYRVRLSAGARAGTLPRTTARSVEWSFSLPPLLDTLDPPPGQSGLGPRPALRVAFHYPLDCGTTLRAFSIHPEATGILACKDHTLVFSPTLPLEPDSVYVADLENVYLEGDPAPRAGVRWEFRTAAPLTVEQVTPVATGFLIDLQTPFRITFNRPVITHSAESRLSLLSEVGTTLPGQVTWEQKDASLVLHPAEPLRPGSRYWLVLQRGVQDELGFELAEPLELSYNTLEMLGLPLPHPGSRGVALDSALRVPFTRPMDKASVEAGLIISPSLEGKVTWEEDTLVLTPRRGLLPDTIYQVGLTPGVRDASGAPLARAREWSFATQPFLVEAQVPGKTPLDKLGQPLEFTFALPMDRSSVRAALTISPTTPADLVWSDDGRTVTIQPVPGWVPGADYEVTLSASARAADGSQALGADRSFAYSTAVAEVRFGAGPSVQVMDVQGQRSFQVIVRGADLAGFGLHAITPAEFLAIYNAGAGDMGPTLPQAMATLALTPTVEWREALTPLGEQMSDGWQPAEGHLPSDVPPGLYVLSAQPPSTEQGQLLVVLTGHVLLLKEALAGTGSRSQAQVLAWDTEISGAAPVVSATVRLYDRNSVLLAEGITSAEGLLSLQVPGDPGPVVALADRRGDVTVCGLGSEWSQASSGAAQSPLSPRPLTLTYSYTDRPIYRPEQIVYFKDVIRADDDVSYTLPAPDLPVTVRLRDARDNVAATQVLTPTVFGTLHGGFPLVDGAMLGTWNLETEVDGDLLRLPFQVEEYHRSEYDVTVHTPARTYVPGEAISVTVEADYHFSLPVTNAAVRVLAYPAYAEDLDQGDAPLFGPPFFSEEGRTDAQGRWTLLLPSEGVFTDHDSAQRALLAVEATVTDAAGQAVSSYQTVVVQRTSQLLTLSLDKRGYLPGETIGFSAVVRNRDSGPAAGVELSAHVLAGDGSVAAAATGRTDQAGQADFALRLAEGGWYLLRLSGTDDGGRSMEVEDYLWLYDPLDRSADQGGRWAGAPSLVVSPDRQAYAAGDLAHVAVYAPLSGPALLTFQRGETHYAEAITLISGTNLISIPIRPDYSPNIHVSVNQYAPSDTGGPEDQSRPESQLHQASTQLLVPVGDRRLTVTVTADREVYAPGDQATIRIQVRDQEGRPVVAELSLAVVDEAIYALAADRSRDLFDAFYGPRPDLVRTFDSLRPTRWLAPEPPSPVGPDAEVAAAPRRESPDTAYWAPAITTSEDGEAAFTFVLPENLAQWRVLARAVTSDTLVGQTTAPIVVRQEILIRPVLPSFLTQGDSVTLAAMVHNATAQPVSATVQLELDGFVLDGAIEQVVHIPAGGATPVTWPVTAGEPGQAHITIRATATRGARLVGRDSVEWPLPVHPLAVTEPTTWAGELSPASPTETISISLPSAVLTTSGQLQIHLAPSLASALVPGLAYLGDYPDASVEQTMSRVLPNVLLARSFRQLGLSNVQLETELPSIVDHGLQRLYGFQHDDGGWGWWYDDRTDVNQTAYVLFGLAMTEQAGFAVDDSVMARGAQLLRLLRVEADPPAQAYSALALAAAGQPFSLTLTLTEALGLDLFSQAALAVALDLAGDAAWLPGSAPTTMTALLDNLRAAAIQQDAAVHWEERGDAAAYSRTVMGSSVRTTALVTDALLRVDPEDPLLPGAVRWLMEQRQGQGWGDTQRTSYVLLALADYLRIAPETAVGSGFRVLVNGELWQEGVLDAAAQGQVLSLPVEALRPGENRVELALGAGQQAPSGRIYHAAVLSLHRAPSEDGFPPLQGHGQSIGIKREYRPVGSDAAASVSFQQGDLVEVQLTLEVPQESWYLVIEDPLPAGLEALNERLGTASHLAAAREEPILYWEEYGYNRKNVRDERVTFFITHLGSGRQTFTYLARATTAGSFTALPAQVYPMYEPEVWSRSDSARCLVNLR